MTFNEWVGQDAGTVTGNPTLHGKSVRYTFTEEAVRAMAIAYDEGFGQRLDDEHGAFITEGVDKI